METKLIFQADLARNLLKKGFRIVDIKPKKENRDSSIFIFEKTEELMKELSNWNK